MTLAAKPDRPGSRPVAAQRQVRELDPKRRADATVATPPTRPLPSALPISPALRAQQALELKRRLDPLIGARLALTVTDNRAVMISVRRDPKRKDFQVRLHHVFVDAFGPVLRDLARYILLNDPSASRRLNRFIEDNDHRIDRDHRNNRRQRRERPAPLRHQGRVYDLKEILDELDRKYFDGKVGARITWGRNRARGSSRHSIRLGTCCLETRLIRIHPGLDQPWVPRYYLEWVVYHEMLHCVHPVPVVNGRRVFHGRTFAAAERRYAGHEQAAQWERRNVATLLCI